MNKKKTIEAEGGELVIRNENSNDIAIIPKAKRGLVLQMLKDNDHEGIDKIVSELPSMEDYAEDGTLIYAMGGKPDPTSTSSIIEQQALGKLQSMSSNKSEVELNIPKVQQPKVETPESLSPYSEEFGIEPVKVPNLPIISTKEMEGLVQKWGEERQKYKDITSNWEGMADEVPGFQPNVPYKNQTPNFDVHGCLGSACRFTTQTLPELPSYYDIREKAGILGVTTGQKGQYNRDYPQIDSWDFAGTIETMGLGENVFRPNKNFEDIKGSTFEERESKYKELMKPLREEFAKSWDDKVTAGMVFTKGLADDPYSGYTNPGDKSIIQLVGGKTKESKQEVRPRHSVTAGPLNEDGDRWIWDVDEAYLVGNSGKPGVMTPEDFMKEGVMYATSLKDHGNWSKNRYERAMKHNRSLGK